MARPQKEGLDYFPLDVDFDQDDKLIVPIAKFGMQGLGVIVKLMSGIYKNGYHYNWGEKEQYVFANRVSVDINTIKSVVNECIKWGFFHHDLYEKYNILTSKGFQKRYIEAAKRRKEILLIREYTLVDAEELSQKFNIIISIVDVNGNKVNVYKNRCKGESKATETPQSKVKESKVKKSKEENNKKPPSRQREPYAEDSVPYRMAAYLHRKIMDYAESISVGHLVRNANIQKWADECRKLLELDKRDKDEVRQVIDWATSNLFWRRNILSPDSLRRQYKKLCIDMADERAKKRMANGGEGHASENGWSRRGKVFGKYSGEGRALQIADDELDQLNEQSVQMLQVSGYGHN